MSADSPASGALAPGQMLGHYAIIRRLGRGGMGEVFLAQDTRLDRRVALKVLPPAMVEDGERLHRFEREAKTLAALNHPNIVTIFAVEEAAGCHVLVMELVEGQSLRQAITKGRGLPLRQFFDIAIPLAEALSAAHERSVTHRDLKPENVMVTDSGRVKVLDFGLAKVAQSDDLSDAGQSDRLSTLTQDGVILGTVPYMSPEQAQGKAVDHRSDIFSLGIVLYEMLVGERPFKGENVAELISAILRDAPTSVSDLRPRVPRHLARIIRHCLEKDPKQRLQSALELFNQLRDLRQELEIENALSSSKRRGASPEVLPGAGRGWPRLGSTFWLATKPGLALLILAVFALNFCETASEDALKAQWGLGAGWGYQLAAAAHALEGRASFEFHDVTSAVAVYGYSCAYFFVLPAIFLGLLLAFARRPDLAPFRVLSLSLVLAYVISLPFFLFFPVLERWALPESEAILLSDLWSSRLIAAFRPISGLDNCFPSFHVASAVALILCSYLFRLRLRTMVLAGGLMIILSTYVLGIHWITDILAGLALGVTSVALAWRIHRGLDASSEEQATVALGPESRGGGLEERP